MVLARRRYFARDRVASRSPIPQDHCALHQHAPRVRRFGLDSACDGLLVSMLGQRWVRLGLLGQAAIQRLVAAIQLYHVRSARLRPPYIDDLDIFHAVPHLGQRAAVVRQL